MLELAVLSDRNAVEALARQVHELHVQWRPDIFEMPPEIFHEQRYLAHIRARELYVAREKGIVIGYVLLKIRPYDWPGVVRRKVMVIDEICVHEQCRGCGIGKQMMLEVRALAKAFGCTDMQLGVYPQNNEALAFYQKCGFRIRSIDMQAKI